MGSVMTEVERTQLQNMCPVAKALSLDQRLRYLDSDGSFNGPIQLDTVTTDTLVVTGGTWTTVPMSIGAFVAGGATGSGISVSADVTAATAVFADDAGAAIGSGSLVRAIRGRLLKACATQSEAEFAAVQGQFVMKSTTAYHNTCGVMGSYEVHTAGTIAGQIATTDPWIAAGVIGRVGGASITLANYGVLAGLAAMSNIASGQLTNTAGGTYAGLYVGKWSGTTDWAYGIYIEPSAVATAIKIGTLSSDTAGSGVTLDATTTKAVEVHADDNDTARATGTKNIAIAGRLMIYKDNACEDWGVHGLSKMSAVAKTGNVSAGVVGAFEATGTCSTATGQGNTFCAGVMGRVGTGTGFTIGAGTYVACVLAFGNQQNATPFTNAGYCAFLATVTDVGTPQKFDYGMYIDPVCCNKGIVIGTESTSATGSGIVVDADSQHYGTEFYFDDGGTALAAGWIEAFRVGYLVSAVPTADADIGLSAFHAYTYLAQTTDTNGGFSGIWGSLLVKTGKTIEINSGIGDFAGGHFGIDVPSGAIIGASTFACGLSIGGNLGGTHTGKAVAFRVRTPSAGEWDALCDIPAHIVGGSDGSGAATYIDIFIAGVAARITAKYVA